MFFVCEWVKMVQEKYLKGEVNIRIDRPMDHGIKELRQGNACFELDSRK